MVPMFKIKNVLHPIEQLADVEIRSDSEIVVRLKHAGPFVLKGEDAKEFMAQVEPATVPRAKVIGLKEQAPEKKEANTSPTKGESPRPGR